MKYTLGILLLICTISCKSQRSNKTIDNAPELNTTIGNIDPSSKGDKGNKEVVRIADYKLENDVSNLEKAVFAGGCFWCVEASFQQIEGVVESISGYSGGHVDFPSYRLVCKETTGHAEAVFIYYDKNVITYEELLDVFFVAHDPTTLNRQGADIGESYRSAIFPMDDSQRTAANSKIETINKEKFDNGIVTQVVDYDEFWVAEAYHQDYFWINPNQSYVANVSRPKVEKVAKVFKSKLKEKYRR